MAYDKNDIQSSCHDNGNDQQIMEERIGLIILGNRQGVAGWHSDYSGQYRQPHFSKDMGLSPAWGVATPAHPTVMGYLTLLCGFLQVEVLKTNSCISL